MYLSMKIKRKLIHTSKLGRSLMVPAMWLESFREQGHDIEYVYLEIQPDDSMVLTPVLEKQKKSA